jgi:hypothetical protein
MSAPLSLLQSLFPGTLDDALRLVLLECNDDVDRSIALITSLMADKCARRGTCRVVASWTARSDRELSVVRGATLRNVCFVDGGVWAVCCDRNLCVPAVCLRLLHNDVIAVAVRDYDAAGKAGHLSFHADEQLLLLSRIPGYDWWYAMRRAATADDAAAAASAAVGRVPITLLRVVANRAVFEAAERLGASAESAAALLPKGEPPDVDWSESMEDALTEDDEEQQDGDDFEMREQLFDDAAFLRAERLKRDEGDDDEQIQSAVRDLLRAKTPPTLRRQSCEDSTSSEESLRLNPSQATLLRQVLQRLQ